MFKKLTILTLLLLIIAKLSYAQTYPVTASTQIIPPYSTYLADYVAPGTNRLALNIFLGDVNRPELRIKLKLSIIGQGIRIETKPEYLPPALILQGGVPERLIASDLAEYFRPENLNFQGITRQQFQRTGQLPEGLYQFCFEVLEYNRSVKISNSACAIAWLILNDPPVVNIPRNGEKLRPQDPQYVTFQWTPRHTGSPNSAFATEYEFSMVEIWPDSRNPNDAILTSPPIYQTTTQSTTLIYGPAETPLVPGRHYAFRIRAKSISGIDELDLFKNQGYSQTYSFIYGDACTLPQNITAEVINSAKFKVKWQPNFNHSNFTVRYREANASSQWYQAESFFDDKEIRGLKEATKYEYQVMAGCGPFVSEFSPIAYATTDSPPEIEYSCGLPPEEFNIGNTQPLPTLYNGDIIYAGDFDVKVLEASGSAGTFSGKGTVKVPYLDNLIVSVNFSGISINTDYRMTSGSMNVEGIGVDVLPDKVTDFIDKLDETLVSVDDILNDVSNGLDLSDEILDAVGDLANEILDNGSFSDSTEFAIQDFTPEQYLAEAKKRVTEAVEEAINGGLSNVAENKKVAKKVAQALALTKRANKLKDIYANSDTIKVQAVEFYANASGTPDGKFGFDISKYPQHRLHYNIMVLPDNTTIPVPWAAAKAGEQIQVKVRWLPNSGVPADSIIFKSGADGETLSAGRNGNEWTIMLPQISKDQSLVVNAVNSGTNDIVGKLNAFGYETLSRKVHIVPVGTSEANFSKEELTGYLNEVYAQALATWDVTLEAAIQIPEYTGSSAGQAGTLQDDEQALLSTYSNGMKAIIKGYKASATIIDNEFYLFLVDKSQTGKSGYMPRKHQFGFIYMGESGDTKRTIAHELGHGAFRLQHTWEEYPGIAQGTSNNLMDYAPIAIGELRKYQWDLIHNPPIVIGLVEDLDEGALAGKNKLEDLIIGYQTANKKGLSSFTLVSTNFGDVYPTDYSIRGVNSIKIGLVDNREKNDYESSLSLDYVFVDVTGQKEIAGTYFENNTVFQFGKPGWSFMDDPKFLLYGYNSEAASGLASKTLLEDYLLGKYDYEVVQDFINKIIDSNDHGEETLDMKGELTDHQVYARNVSFEDKGTYDLYISRTGDFSDDVNSFYNYTKTEITTVFGFTGSYTQYRITNTSGGTTSITLPTSQTERFETSVLKLHSVNTGTPYIDLVKAIRAANLNADSKLDITEYGSDGGLSPVFEINHDGEKLKLMLAYPLLGNKKNKIDPSKRPEPVTGQTDNAIGKAGKWVLYELENNKGTGTGHNTKIYVMGAQMELFESYLLIAQEVLITGINWRSQVDSYFSGYTCYGPPNECCYQASKTILEQFSITTDRSYSTDVAVLANTSPDYNTLRITNNFETGLEYLESTIKPNKQGGKPVVIGVHYNHDYASKNGNKATYHFIIVVGKGYDRNVRRHYYRYYEVGTSDSSIALSTRNKLYVDKSQRTLSGTGARDIYYTVTEIRQNH